MVTMEHKQSIPTSEKAHVINLNLNDFKMIGALGLNIIASRSP
jgi:hypothetical protein